MTNINKQISFMYIEYSTAFHMKFKHLFIESVYDCDGICRYPLVITWAEANMEVTESNKCLVIATQTAHYEDKFKVTENFFEDALQAFFLFPDSNDEEEASSKLRLEFVKALLNS